MPPPFTRFGIYTPPSPLPAFLLFQCFIAIAVIWTLSVGFCPRRCHHSSYAYLYIWKRKKNNPQKDWHAESNLAPLTLEWEVLTTEPPRSTSFNVQSAGYLCLPLAARDGHLGENVFSITSKMVQWVRVVTPNGRIIRTRRHTHLPRVLCSAKEKWEDAQPLSHGGEDRTFWLALDFHQNDSVIVTGRTKITAIIA